jgi:hypothetical protein
MFAGCVRGTPDSGRSEQWATSPKHFPPP